MSGVLDLRSAERLWHGGTELGEAWLGGQRVWQRQWTPSLLRRSGDYIWEASALDAPALVGGRTVLRDLNGGGIDLTAVDTAAGSQPVWRADAGDGRPALQFTVSSAAQRLTADTNINLSSASLFYLVRIDLAEKWAGVLTIGKPSTATRLNITHAEANTTTFRGTIGAFGALKPNTGSSVNLAVPVWVTGVLELVAGTGWEHRVNGVLANTGAFTAPFVADRIAIATNQNESQGSQMAFAHAFLLRGAGPDLRARGVGYLLQQWGARVRWV